MKTLFALCVIYGVLRLLFETRPKVGNGWVPVLIGIVGEICVSYFP